MSLGFKLIELDEIDSTNRYLKDYCSTKQPTEIVFCVTKKQTHGYGQQKRSWVSNADSLLFSLAYPVAGSRVVSGLSSLQVAVLAHKVLQSMVDEKLYLKWPNDLFTDRGKVAGILIEQVIKDGYRCLVIGIGINRNRMDEVENSSAVSFFDSKQFFTRFYELLQECDLFDFSIETLMDYWCQNDFFEIGEPVQLQTGVNSPVNAKQSIQGFYDGISKDGLAKILFINEQGEVSEKRLSSGLNSIRKI